MKIERTAKNMIAFFSAEEELKADFSLLEEQEGVAFYRIALDWAEKRIPGPVKMRISHPCRDLYSHWSPVWRSQRHIPWGGAKAFESRLGFWMPLEQFCSKNGENRLTLALADVKTPIRIASGVGMPCFDMDTEFTFFTGTVAPLSHYETVLRIDCRAVDRCTAIRSAMDWYSSMGYCNREVPKAAFDAVYSTWYAYMQDVKERDILRECRLAKQMGIDTLILDDGWQNVGIVRDYSTCGDWQPAPNRFPDMRRFAEEVHKLGVKVMLWFSVPFVGWDSKNFKRFEGKYLYTLDKVRCSILDPRYPEVRRFLVETYARAVEDWGLDGLKLDFIDRFKSNGIVTPEMDYSSVEDAVETLLREITDALKGIRSDILIEFRQPYIGPVISTYGNMIRVWDCPEDPLTNRLSIADLRLLGGGSAVHSDMIVWQKGEPIQSVATHLYSALFAVPQISVRMAELSKEHRQVLKAFLTFRNRHREILMKGKFTVCGMENNASYTEAVLEDRRIAVITAAPILQLEEQFKEDYAINLSGADAVFIAKAAGVVKYQIFDCMGKQLCRLKTLRKNDWMLPVPHAGMIRFVR